MESLPDELLIEILQYIPYWTLRLQIAPVNVRLRRFIGAGGKRSLDQKLFQDTPADTPSSMDYDILLRRADAWSRDWRLFYPGKFSCAYESDAYQLHPILNMLHYACSSSLFCDIKVCGKPEEGGEPLPPTVDNAATSKLPKLEDLPACAENVTSPAVARLILAVRHFPPIVIEGTSDITGAVSVRDVMEGLLATLSTRVTTRCRLFWHPQLQSPRWPSGDMWGPLFRLHESKELWNSWTPRATEAMTQICGWTGVQRLLVISGVVHLFVELPAIRLQRSAWEPSETREFIRPRTP